VARLQDRAIVASHAYNTVIDLNGVKEVLTSDQLSVRPGVHFSFASGGSAWHLMSDVEGRIFILISERAYPVRAANACLDEFQRSVRGYVGCGGNIRSTPFFILIFFLFFFQSHPRRHFVFCFFRSLPASSYVHISSVLST
jgi:hypothetical protein